MTNSHGSKESAKLLMVVQEVPGDDSDPGPLQTAGVPIGHNQSVSLNDYDTDTV